jgi:hypothetical protein
MGKPLLNQLLKPEFAYAPRHFKVVPHRHHWAPSSAKYLEDPRLKIWYKLDPFIGSVSSPEFMHERGGLILSVGHNRFAAHTQRRAS